MAADGSVIIEIKGNAEEFEKELKDLKSNLSGAAESFGGAFKSGLVTAAKVGAAGAAAAGTAVAALAKSSVESYASYEQLVGGIETLFKQSSDTVKQYASNAYKTAGMSANQYMETVTGFSASLLQSLGGDTEKAAAAADMAVVDMADNANKMGTSIESIQNAYQGFAKQNYTMLDNLKLGYGGTKEEMERLIADANAVKVANGEMADLSIDSFANVVEAIHIMQNEMGIAGATAQEAEGTISGSAATMMSAWQNLVTGLADENANVDELLANFLDALETTAGNVLPVIQRAMESIFRLLADNGPEIIVAGAKLIGNLAAGAIKAIPDIVASIPTIVMAIAEGFAESGPEFIEIGKNIVEGIWEGIKSLISWIKGKAKDFVGGLVSGIKETLGIHSPSSVMRDEVGKMLPRGVALGISDDAGKAVNEAKDMAEEITAAAIPDLNNSGLMNRLKNAVQNETMRFSVGLGIASRTGTDAARSAASLDAVQSVPGWDGVEELLQELRAIRKAIADGKILTVNGKVIGQVASDYIKNTQRAYGT